MSDWLPPPRTAASTPRIGAPTPRGEELLTGTALLIDISGSMASQDDGGTRRRIDRLTDILRDALADAPGARTVTFGDQVRELVGLEPGPALQLPEPGGSTPLAEALQLIGTWQPKPGRIIVLSDGRPDDGPAALAAARTLKPAIISGLFIGPDSDRTGIALMKALSLMGGKPGKSGLRSLNESKALTAEIKGLLAGPAR